MYPPDRPPPEATLAKGMIYAAALIALPTMMPLILGAAGTALVWFLLINKVIADAIGATSALPLLFFEIGMFIVWINYRIHRKQIRAIGWKRMIFGRGMF